MTKDHRRRPAAWAVVLAFTLVYTSWGTTFLAIREGVYFQQLPPALFSGTRVALAGWLLFGYLALRGEVLRVPLRDCFSVLASSLLLFVGGNGLVTLAERTVESGATAVLAATTPLWMAVMETAVPGGDRLSARGWLGLLTGLAGVLVLLAPGPHRPGDLLADPGPLLILGSAACWAAGSLVVRYRRPGGSHLARAAYQMIIGGTGLALVGFAFGEASELTPDRFTPRAAFAFVYLLIVGSLVGFVAFNWLLGHVSATLVGTHSYVNPVIAILVGWALGGEELTARVVGGMVVILCGVALVRGGGRRPVEEAAPRPFVRGLTWFWQSSAVPKNPAPEE